MACASVVSPRSGWSRLGSTEWSNFSCSISSMSYSHCGSMVRWDGSDPHVFHLPWANGLAKSGSSGNGRDMQEQALSYKCFRWLQSHHNGWWSLGQIKPHDHGRVIQWKSGHCLLDMALGDQYIVLSNNKIYQAIYKFENYMKKAK